MRQKVEQVLKDFQAFVGDIPIVGYNAAKSDLPILLVWHENEGFILR